MLYYTGKDSGFKPITLGDCSDYCPIEEYVKIIKAMLPSDEEVDALFQNVNINFKKLCCDCVIKENSTLP